eukprot:gene4026-4265_t
MRRGAGGGAGGRRAAALLAAAAPAAPAGNISVASARAALLYSAAPSCRLLRIVYVGPGGGHGRACAASGAAPSLSPPLVELFGPGAGTGGVAQGAPVPLTCGAAQAVGGAANCTYAGAGVEARLRVAADGGGPVRFSLWVRSNGAAVTHHAVNVAGLSCEGGGAAPNTLYWPKASGVRIRDPARADVYGGGRNVGNLSSWYTGHLSMPWAALESDDAALAVTAQSWDPQLRDLRMDHTPSRAAAGASDLRFVKLRPVPAAAAAWAWDAPPVVVDVVEGGWRAAAELYRGWAAGRLAAPRYAPWQRYALAINGPHSMQAQSAGPGCRTKVPGCEGRASLTFRNISAFQAERAAAGYGWDMWLAGQQVSGWGCCYRWYQPDPFLGSEEELRAANLEMRARGARVLFYTNGFEWDSQFPADLPGKYASHGLNTSIGVPWAGFKDGDCIVADASGDVDSAVTDGYCLDRMPGVPEDAWVWRAMCPGGAWTEYLQYWMARYARDLRAGGMMSDQIGALYLGHCRDGLTTQRTVIHLKALLEAGREHDAEWGVHIEGTADVYGAYAWNMGNSAPYARWGHYRPGPCQPNRDSHVPGCLPREIIFPEMYRFTFPEHILRSSSFIPPDQSFLLALQPAGLWPAMEAAREVVLTGTFRGTVGIVA